jgi:branched-chain amino acid transport system substrate-binding protein
VNGKIDAGRVRWPWTAMGFILCLAFFSCSPPEPIRIGFIGGTSGRVADLGIAGRDGAILAIEICNQTGGVSGRKVQLITKNDEQTPEVAERCMRELIAEGVLAIVGPMTSAMGVAVVPIVNETRILLISPTATTEELTGRDDFLFRVTSTTGVFASRNARYQIKAKRMRRVAAVYDLGNKSFTENWFENFRHAFAEGGGEIVKTLTFKSGSDTKYLEIARDLLAILPDGVLIIANSMDSALICQQIRKLDTQMPITLSDWGATERLLELGGKAVEGLTVVQTFDRNSTVPRYQEFRQTYLERFNREPGFAGVYAFDAANVVLEALKKRKEAQSLKETILAVRKFEGLQSSFSFDDFGDVRRPHVSISIVRDGQFVVVE